MTPAVILDQDHPRALAIQGLVDFYETMSPTSIARLDRYYAPDAHFIDPFNDVSGLPAIRRIFEHMFTQVADPSFEVIDVIAGPDRCVLIWLFRFGAPGSTRHCIQGASHVRWDAQDRVIAHRDYWDPARELYERIPLLGWLMRGLRRRLSAH